MGPLSPMPSVRLETSKGHLGYLVFGTVGVHLRAKEGKNKIRQEREWRDSSLSLSCPVTWSRSLHLPEPQLPQLPNGAMMILIAHSCGKPQVRSWWGNAHMKLCFCWKTREPEYGPESHLFFCVSGRGDTCHTPYIPLARTILMAPPGYKGLIMWQSTRILGGH